MMSASYLYTLSVHASKGVHAGAGYMFQVHTLAVGVEKFKTARRLYGAIAI